MTNLAVAVDDLQLACHKASRDAGWWNEYEELSPSLKNLWVGTKLALIHSEVSEAMEAYRKNTNDDHLPKRKGVEVELADAIIRICDLAEGLELNLGGALVEKMEYNAVRPDHKLEARAAEGGKSF